MINFSTCREKIEKPGLNVQLTLICRTALLLNYMHQVTISVDTGKSMGYFPKEMKLARKRLPGELYITQLIIETAEL